MSSSTETENGRKSRTLWLTIAAVPLIGYAMAFLYEVGFCGEFGIPREFISLSLTRVFIAAGALVGVAFVMFWFVELFLHFAPQPERLIFKHLAFFFSIFLLNLAMSIVFWGLWREIIMVWLIFVFFMLQLFVLPLITQRKKGSYLEKLEAQRRIDFQTRSLLDYFARFFGREILIIILVILVVLVLSYLAGVSQAKKQTEFLIPSTYPDSVVMRIYGDNMICAPFDRQEKEIEGNFFVLKVGDKLSLRLEKVGPLKPRK